MDNNDYRTYEDYRKDMEDGNIVIVEIQKNAEVPTGILEVTLKNGEVKDLYVSDTSKEASLLYGEGIPYREGDVLRESWFVTYLVPSLIILAVVFFLFTMMNNQSNAGGGGKMMNFGKSRAKMINGENTVTFKEVAGLNEEKEELKEIVDFLKTPKKYILVGI